MPISIQKLIEKYQKNREFYRGKEIGDGTQWFSKDILESDIFSLSPGNAKISHTYRYEATRGDDGDRGDDFILNIDGIIVPVEVEMYENLKKWEWQIEKYMKRKNALYGILTDGWTWRFYTRGYHGGYTTLTLPELATEDWKRKKDKLFEKKDYYLTSFTSLSTLVSQSEFIIEDFHADLIRLAEDVLADFELAGAFGSEYDDGMKIKGVYSFIIQFILLKIIQDKKNIDLLSVSELVDLLEREEWNKLTQHIFKKLGFLARFYTSYKNEQETILEKIRTKYSEEGIYEWELVALRPFLDLYVFIIKYNFKSVKQDIFGTVYENYLKERYKEDDTKKWQVFTPPDIVEYMLEEVGYTEIYIKNTIESYGIQNIKNTFAQSAPIGKSNFTAEEIEKQYFNIPGLSIIDPACGSGTFLYKAASRIVNTINTLDLTSHEKWLLAEALIINNIVWFDIEAFPLYLAEMNILMTLLYHNIDNEGNITNPINRQIRIFSTTDSIAEFANSGETIIDTTIRAFRGDTLSNTLLSKRDEEEILKIYLDIRDIDPTSLRINIRKAYIREFIESKYSPDILKVYDKSTSIEDFEKKTSIERIGETTEEEYIRKSIPIELKKKKDDLRSLDTKIDEIILRHETKRVKFDFVVGNPPYVKWDAKYDNANLFGININDPKYSKIDLGDWNFLRIWNSQFNIYGYFYYLWYYLMNDNAKIAFITPRSILQQPSFHKLRSFLKDKCSIQKIYDFWIWSLFYWRGLDQNILVATDSTIIIIEKWKKPQYPVILKKYTGVTQKIVLKDFLENCIDEKIENNKLFTVKSWLLFAKILTILESKWDFHLSIYSRIPIWWKNDQSNTVWLWLPIFLQNSYITLQHENERWYDYNSLGAIEEYPTTKNIISKKYRLTWSSVSGRQKRHIFTFTDYKHIHNWNAFTSIGIDNEENLPELFYLFWLLNSESIFRQLQDDFWWICNMTNLQLLVVPDINSHTQESLKQSLIENSEKIIALAKSTQNIRTYRDLYETRIDGLDERVGDIRSEYIYVAHVLSPVMDIGMPLPKEILKLVRSSNPEMKKLEGERDEIVNKLYNISSE